MDLNREVISNKKRLSPWHSPSQSFLETCVERGSFQGRQGLYRDPGTNKMVKRSENSVTIKGKICIKVDFGQDGEVIRSRRVNCFDVFGQ